MAWDVYLRDHIASPQNPVLRFYKWERPTLSLGHSQRPDRVVNWDFCLENGIDVVRRPTGGRAVLHHLEITYSLSGHLGTGPFPNYLQDTFHLISGALEKGLSYLGIPAEITQDTGSRPLSPKTQLPCFASPAPGEIGIKGKKLIGSAMHIQKNRFLQHGSILLDFDPWMQKNAQLFPFESGVSTLKDYLNVLDESAIIQTLVNGFSDYLAIPNIDAMDHRCLDSRKILSQSSCYTIQPPSS